MFGKVAASIGLQILEGRRKGGMARKFWQKKNTIMLIAIIFLWYNHKHEVNNKQVRSSAGMIDMSDG